MRISLLIDSPLAVVMHVVRGMDAAVRREWATYTRSEAGPIWEDELRGRALSRRQSRLAESGRVGVTAQNVFLRAGQVGKLSSGTPISAIAKATEWGADPSREITTRSRKGTTYKRKLGPTFGAPRRSGHVVFPAARDAVPRIASLLVQTAHRTLHEQMERIGRG